MIITIFYILLLIVQIIMLVKSIKTNDKKYWVLLFSTTILSIVNVILFFIYSWINVDYIGIVRFLIYLIINIAVSIIYILILIVSIIMKVMKNKKNKFPKLAKNESEKKNIGKILIINIVIIFITFIIALFLEELPYKIQQNNDRLLKNKAEEQIIHLLNQRYGDGNFEIIEMNEGNICTGCSWMGPGIDGYEFVMSTNYLENNFEVSLTKENLEIYEDDFLNNYYKEKLEISDFKNYLKEYKVDKVNKIISQNFNADIKFNNVFVGDYADNNYGHVPSIDELSDFVELYDPKIEIKENLTTKEELLDYLKKILKFFIEELNDSDITYSQTDKYFRYKYDYTKLGVDNYSDQYNGYGGYVLAGRNQYSEEQGHYITVDEDTIVRIKLMKDLYTFNIQEILDN